MSALKFAEGYIKPRQVRQFSSSARKRASIRALGSITYLQKYYASGGAICEGLMDFAKLSFIDSIGPRAGLMSPSPEILLRNCHEDIQSVLEVWGIISYPSNGHDQSPLDSPISVDENDLSYQLGHGKDFSSSLLNAQQQHRYDNVTVDMLALLESSTKAISSIRTYSMHAPVLSATALTIHRQAALSVIEMLSIMEQENRVLDSENEMNHPEDYCYARVSFGDLEEERAAMKEYLAIVQEHLFKPQVKKIETQLEQLLISNPGGDSEAAALPKWMNDDEWTTEEGEEISLDRCQAFLEFFKPTTRDSLPSPSTDKNGFLEALSDGYVVCMVFNAFIRLTNMPFGVVDKVHEDTTRTWRAADNWRFLIQACKFRLEFKIDQDSFKPIDIVKQTELGRQQLETWVKLIVLRGIQEAKETLEAKKPESPVLAPTVFVDF
ncbi:hypothetical protein BGX29_012199 [Mortierella sp. GBA35]|nr:hypothetical protein BGX23_012219 [Mortierella sp. AD031]KAF9089117.1 hypothetical protein BGX29_012199 [Mortierella sp. GBA35]KAG0205014.1 hypothetical protein BGX33_008164 [Mortierella sp. NVP41]